MQLVTPKALITCIFSTGSAFFYIVSLLHVSLFLCVSLCFVSMIYNMELIWLVNLFNIVFYIVSSLGIVF